VGELREALLKKRLGPQVYWRRRNLLEKFDDWDDYGGRYPWHWGFEEIKNRRHGPIRTPMQFIKKLSACVRFVAEEQKKDPNYEPPAAFLDLMVRVKSMLDSLRPTIEARLMAIKGGQASV
jgi:hypothetical protein